MRQMLCAGPLRDSLVPLWATFIALMVALLWATVAQAGDCTTPPTSMVADACEIAPDGEQDAVLDPMSGVQWYTFVVAGSGSQGEIRVSELSSGLAAILYEPDSVQVRSEAAATVAEEIVLRERDGSELNLPPGRYYLELYQRFPNVSADGTLSAHVTLRLAPKAPPAAGAAGSLDVAADGWCNWGGSAHPLHYNPILSRLEMDTAYQAAAREANKSAPVPCHMTAHVNGTLEVLGQIRALKAGDSFDYTFPVGDPSFGFALVASDVGSSSTTQAPQPPNTCNREGYLPPLPRQPPTGCVLTVEWWYPPDSSPCGLWISESALEFRSGVAGYWWYEPGVSVQGHVSRYTAKYSYCEVADYRNPR